MSSVQQRIGTAATAIAIASLHLPLATAHAAEPDDCVTDGNVWVVVQHEAGTTGGCATEFGDGFEVLTSAGIPHLAEGGFMTTVDGEPQAPGAEDWWSYWSATLSDDGALSWESQVVGPGDARPEGGSVEGWRLAHSFSEQAPPPDVQQLGDAPGQEPTAGSEATEEAGSPAGLLVGAGAVVLVAAAGGVVLWRRRRAA